MKSKPIFIFLILVLASCSPQKRLARLIERYPIPADTVVETRIEYRDTIIEVEIPGDSVEVAVYIDRLVEVPDTAIKTATAYASASAGITAGELWLQLVQTDTMIVYELDSVIVTEYKDKIVTQTVTVEKKGSSFFRAGFFTLAGLILVVVALVLLLRRR